MSAGTEGENGSANTSKSSDLRVRTFSAMVLMPPAIIIAYLGGVFYTVGIALLGYLLAMEWCAMVSRPDHRNLDRALSFGLALSVIAAGIGYWTAAIGLLFGILVVAVAAAFLVKGGRWLAAGVGYSGLACLSLILLRQGDAGTFLLLLLLTIVWSTDIAAYFVGRSIGGPKLWPAVSPKKTWSGSIGGLVFGVLAGVGLLMMFGVSPDGEVVLLTILLSMATQIGDLIESAFKRYFSVKDSGNLIPGHGGVLDRLDGLLLAAIVATLLGAGNNPLLAVANEITVGF